MNKNNQTTLKEQIIFNINKDFENQLNNKESIEIIKNLTRIIVDSTIENIRDALCGHYIDKHDEIVYDSLFHDEKFKFCGCDDEKPDQHCLCEEDDK